MKSFVITVMDIKDSVEAAERCVQSFKPDFDVKIYPAITPKDDPTKIAKSLGLNVDFFLNQAQKYSRLDNCLSAFLSHRSLWQKCVDDNEEYQIFEHDAIRVGNVPQFINYNGCISLGAPSYGKFNTPRTIGTNPLTSKRYFPGAHAYRLKPKAAMILLESSKINACPTDVFLSLDFFPWLEEYYPWPVIARDSFSTIQNVKGCLAKHNYGESYRLI